MKNNSPMDSRTYEWGRYRHTYPRQRARQWAMQEGNEEWEMYRSSYLYGVRSFDAPDRFYSSSGGYNCWCFDECDENCVGHFPNQRPGVNYKLGPKPVHDHTRQKPVRKKSCEHIWKKVEEKNYVERKYNWNKSHNLHLWYPKDPIYEINNYEECSLCHKRRNNQTTYRELLDYEYINFKERVHLIEKDLKQKKKKMEREGNGVNNDVSSKKKRKKSGRKRK